MSTAEYGDGWKFYKGIIWRSGIYLERKNLADSLSYQLFADALLREGLIEGYQC